MVKGDVWGHRFPGSNKSINELLKGKPEPGKTS
jgi:hypothetical protein